MTLKSRLGVTEGHWKRHHSIDHIRLILSRVINVEYYGDLEMWVRDHSRSLKMVPSENHGYGFLLTSRSNYGRIFSRLGDIQRQ